VELELLLHGSAAQSAQIERTRQNRDEKTSPKAWRSV
jgi:hypothetical protein